MKPTNKNRVLSNSTRFKPSSRGIREFLESEVQTVSIRFTLRLSSQSSTTVFYIPFSIDNRQIVSASHDRTIKLWNTLGECKYIIQDGDAHSDWVFSVRFSPSTLRPTIVTVSWDRTVKHQDLGFGEQEKQVFCLIMLADSYMINSLEEEVRTLRLSNKPDRLTASVLNLHLTLWRPPFYWSSTAQCIAMSAAKREGTHELGIAIVNDFKSVEGDRALGLQSLPVAFGSETAKWICVGAIDITQLSVAGYLLGAGKPYYALALLALIAPQVFFQFKYFLKDPVKYDVKLISG
ncbi:hypothetical protein P8452_27302 [Trifolium repens]|nr:hypothetical protein P8452_27302 [Trifolium repens]